MPGGLIFAALYRGRRRPELLITIAVFFMLYLFQRYSTIETSLSKRVILALRYFIPLLPMLAFAMSESVPRLWRQWLARGDTERSVRVEFAAARILVLWLVGLGLVSAAVHPAFSAWSSTQAKIHAAVSETVPSDAVLLINTANRKFIDEIGRRFLTLGTDYVPVGLMRELVARHEEVFLVMLDRNDSNWWRSETRRNADYFEKIPISTELLTDLQPNDTDRLRIWRLRP